MTDELEPAAWLVKWRGSEHEEPVIHKSNPYENGYTDEKFEVEPLVRADHLRRLTKCDVCGSELEWCEDAEAYICQEWGGCEGSISPEKQLERLRDELDLEEKS